MKSKGLMPKANYRLNCLGIIILIFSSSDCLGQAQSTEQNDNISITVEAAAYSLKFKVDDPENYAIVNVSCRGLKTSETFVDGDDVDICKELDPCTTYTALVTIKVINEERETQTNIDAKTSYVEPTVNITEVTSEGEKIHIAWNTTDKACVSAYKLDAVAPNSLKAYDLSRERSDWTIDGLNPCQEHNITLKTLDVDKKLVSTLNETSMTKRIDPGNVTDINIDTSQESGHAKVTWNQPEHNTCISYFYLKWFTEECEEKWREQVGSTVTPPIGDTEDNACSWSEKLADYNAKEYTINGLQGCETYGFQIYIDNELTPKSELIRFTALEEVPSAVDGLPAIVAASNATLSWNVPKSNPKCVKVYEVIVMGPVLDELYNKTTTNTSAVFKELRPCGPYRYTVQPISLNGTRGQIMNSDFETEVDKPSAVRELEIHPTSRAVNISWSVPSYASLCIKEYRVTIWKNGKGLHETKSFNTPELKANVKDLVSCQSYTVQIIPITHNANEGAPLQMDTETSAEKPDATTNINVISIYSDGIELKVLYDTDSNCETIFARIACYPNNEADKKNKLSAEKTVEGKRSGSTFTALVEPLSPYTEYNCDVNLYNVAGYGKTSKITRIETKQYYSDVPENIAVTSSSVNSLTFSWNQPMHPNGNINVYIAYFQRVRAEYFVPQNCSPIKPEPITRESSSRQQTFGALLPYTRYSIQVAAKNEYGVGVYTRPFMAITKPIAAEKVDKLQVIPQGPFEDDDEYRANVLVSWTLPCRANGKIISFNIIFNGTRAEEQHNFVRTIPMPEKIDADGIIVHNETNIKPEYTYQVAVVVRNEDVDVLSAPQKGEFDSPAGIPKRFNETIAKKARVTCTAADNPTNSAVVRFPAAILESESGDIIYGALLVSQKNCNNEPTLKYGALNTRESWPESRKWSDVHADEENMHCIPQYQTTKLRWEPKTNAVGDTIIFTIGTEACTKNDAVYCNGALRPDTEYYLVIRLFTKSGYNDAILLDFHTESLIQLELILISISCCLLFALIAGFAYIYLKKRMQWKRQSCHDIEDPFGDILTKNFATYYNEVARPERIAREFKELTMVAMEFSYAASELGCSKNRYTDIYPYDKNRVILDIDVEGSDYINASFIDGYRLKKQYIATQGPKPESTLDFWRMVLQHNIRVIVMLTQFMEGDVVKCHEYFPYKSKGINVTVKKKETFELYDRSEMSVTHDRYGLKQKVVHFYFKKWPDHGVPVDPAHLITFVRKVKAEKVPSYSSVVVHCSAGVGRTGTFIGLDIIMQRIKFESKINIYGTVKKLRFQRMKMVQTLEQYTFLYKSAYELVKHKDQRSKLKQNGKKVSFKDDTEANAISTIPTLASGASSKNNGKLIPTQLSAIPENEQENAIEAPTTNANLNRERPYLRLNYGSSPALVNGFKMSSDDQSNDNDDDESVM